MYGAKPTASMEAGNPFAAFLASRPSGDTTAKQKFSLGLGKAMISVAPPPTALDGAHDGPSMSGEGNDIYASFLADRPVHPTQEAEKLKADVLRTKKQLLELALLTEQKAAKGVFSEEELARIRRLRVAERYLYHPDRIFEVNSGAGSMPSEAGGQTPLDYLDTAELAIPPDIAERNSEDSGSMAARLMTPSMDATALRSSVPDLRAAALPGGRSGHCTPTGGSRPGSRGSKGSATLQAAGGIAASGSVSRALSAGALGAGTGDSMNLTKLPGTAGSSGSSTKPAFDPAKDQLLGGWYSRTRCFNLMVSKDALQCRRQALSMAGGCIAFGNGRLPLYMGSHLLLNGYYFAFKVHGMDTSRLPTRGSTQGSALAIGISRLSPAEPRLAGSMCPLYGYEVPGAVTVGYGAHLIDDGKWFKTPWDSNNLQIGDKIGVLVTKEGDLVIFHNDVQVLRVETTLAEGASMAKKTYFAMVDLSGHVSELQMLPKAEPPNVPLQVRDTIERKLQ